MAPCSPVCPLVATNERIRMGYWNTQIENAIYSEFLFCEALPLEVRLPWIHALQLRQRDVLFDDSVSITL